MCDPGGVVLETLEARQFLSAAAVSVQSEPPPTAVRAFAGGVRWSQPFKDYLAFIHIGSAEHGVALRNVSVPWMHIDQITVELVGDMVVDVDDLSVQGIRVPAYPVTAVQSGYDGERGTTLVTWTLARPIETDHVVVEVNGDGDRDLEPGGDFRTPLGVVLGDVNRDMFVNALDVASVKGALGGYFGDGRSYYGSADINTDGRVNALDLAAVKRNLGQRLPGGPRAATATDSAPSITEDLFGSAPILA